METVYLTLQQIRERTLKILHDQQGRFVTSAEIGELLGEDPERVNKALVPWPNRPDWIISRKGAGGGYKIPSRVARSDPFFHLGNLLIGQIARYLYANMEDRKYRSSEWIARRIDSERRVVQKTLYNYRHKVGPDFYIEAHRARGYRLRRRPTQADTQPASDEMKERA